VINEIKQDMDSRWFKFNEFFKDIRFTKKSSLKRKISGTIDIVEKLTKEDLLSYWHEYFSPSNTYLFLIGNLNQAEIGNQCFGSINLFISFLDIQNVKFK
jgi:predicted Zn-dependent peptidase